MKIHPRCAPCLLSRVYFEAELSTNDEKIQGSAITAALSVLHETYSSGIPAAEISTRVHRHAYKALGDKDPYIKVKNTSNKVALALLPIAREYVENSEDRFKAALVASIIGNTFDFGVQDFEVPVETFDETFTQLTKKGLAIDDTEAIKKLARGKVVYLADNCGEILFDTLLFKEIHKLGGYITLVVRGEPILNDATMEDVVSLGIDQHVDRVLTTGSNAICVCVKEAPLELLEALGTAGIIISKGMANYETLSEHNYHPIAYLLRAKCEPVSESIGTVKGELVAKLYK